MSGRNGRPWPERDEPRKVNGHQRPAVDVNGQPAGSPARGRNGRPVDGGIHGTPAPYTNLDGTPAEGYDESLTDAFGMPIQPIGEPTDKVDRYGRPYGSFGADGFPLPPAERPAELPAAGETGPSRPGRAERPPAMEGWPAVNRPVNGSGHPTRTAETSAVPAPEAPRQLPAPPLPWERDVRGEPAAAPPLHGFEAFEPTGRDRDDRRPPPPLPPPAAPTAAWDPEPEPTHRYESGDHDRDYGSIPDGAYGYDARSAGHWPAEPEIDDPAHRTSGFGFDAPPAPTADASPYAHLPPPPAPAQQRYDDPGQGHEAYGYDYYGEPSQEHQAYGWEPPSQEYTAEAYGYPEPGYGEPGPPRAAYDAGYGEPGQDHEAYGYDYYGEASQEHQAYEHGYSEPSHEHQAYAYGQGYGEPSPEQEAYSYGYTEPSEEHQAYTYGYGEPSHEHQVYEYGYGEPGYEQQVYDAGWDVPPHAPANDPYDDRPPPPAASIPPPPPPATTAQPAVTRTRDAGVVELAQPAQILDRGYRSYEGARKGRGAAMVSVYRETVRKSLGLKRGATAKAFPVFAGFLAYLPAIVFVGMVAVMKDRTKPDLDRFVDQYMPSYGFYYGYILAAIVIFVAFVAPEVLCTDRRNGMLPLYLASPLDRGRYLLAKAVAVAVSMSVVTVGPALVFLLGRTMNDDGPAGFDGFALTFGKVLAAGVIITVPYLALSFAVSSTTTRRADASAGIVFILSTAWIIPINLVTKAGANVNVLLLDVLQLPIELVSRLYGDRPVSMVWREVPTPTVLAGYAAWTVAFMLFALIRYRRIQVTR
jgi:ABC-2 type transport system permease protein